MSLFRTLPIILELEKENAKLLSGGTRFEVGGLDDLRKLNALVRQIAVEWRAILFQSGLDVQQLRLNLKALFQYAGLLRQRHHIFQKPIKCHYWLRLMEFHRL